MSMTAAIYALATPVAAGIGFLWWRLSRDEFEPVRVLCLVLLGFAMIAALFYDLGVDRGAELARPYLASGKSADLRQAVSEAKLVMTQPALWLLWFAGEAFLWALGKRPHQLVPRSEC